MAEIINLRRAAKAKVRATEAAKADANRAKFGRSKAERSKQDAEKAMENRKLDGAVLSTPDVPK